MKKRIGDRQRKNNESFRSSFHGVFLLGVGLLFLSGISACRKAEQPPSAAPVTESAPSPVPATVLTDVRPPAPPSDPARALISPESWEQGIRGIKISSENDFLHCEWEGTQPVGIVWSKTGIPVTGGKYLALGIEWKTINRNYGAAFIPIVRFDDASGKAVETGEFFSQTKGTGNYGSPPAPEFFSGTPADRWILYRNLVKAPEKAVKCTVGFTFRGNALDCLVKNIEIKHSEVFETPSFKTPSFDHHPSPSNEEIDEILALRPKADGKIKRIGDLNCVFVNGQRITPLIYKNGPTYGSMTNQLSRCATFGAAGFNIFTVTVALGQPSYPKIRNSVWLGENNYDISKLKDAVYDILRHNPDAYIFLELILSPYHEWTVNNPDEIHQNSKGEKGIMERCRVKIFSADPPAKDKPVYWQPSYFSEVYKKDVVKALKDIFSEFEKTPASKAVLGAYLNGGNDGQWFAIYEGAPGEEADYSPAALKSFKNYLRKKYQDKDELLKKAWNDAKVSFDTVRMPEHEDIWVKHFFFSRHSASWQSDFYEWTAQANTERHITWCRAVKEATGGRLLIGSYWPETGLHGYPLPCHRCSKAIYESDAVDFLASVPGYGIAREPAQNMAISAYNGSLLLHEKLLVTELDLRNDEIPNWGYWGNKFYRETHDAKTFYNTVMRFVGYSMAKGGTFHAYDMDGGWWDTPAAIETWERACGIASRAVPQPLNKNRIAVFVDEHSGNYLSLDGDYRMFAYSLKEHINNALWKSGIRFDYYLPEDALNPKFEAPSVLMFSDASTMTPETAVKIREKFGKDNRVIVWFWAPGIFAPGDAQTPSKITGFNLTEEPLAHGKQIYVTEQSDALTKDIKGFLGPVSPDGLTLGPMWRVNAPDDEVLANYFETDIPALAVKRYKNHTEIYIGQPGALTPQLCKNIAKEAGIIPYLDGNDDVSQFGAGLLTVSAKDGGRKTVRLPNAGFSIKCLTGQSFKQLNDNTFEYNQDAYSTVIFSIREKETTQK
ncbi:MAG: hypothetical protein Q7J98_08115 [Kiritimatiellia bacterium]|nr:hypothetical protein [Kiritimatiellia bacterium]